MLSEQDKSARKSAGVRGTLQTGQEFSKLEVSEHTLLEVLLKCARASLESH